MALPTPSENQPFCTVSALEAGHIYLNPAMFIDNATSTTPERCPSLSFLLQHSSNGKKLVFDLGIRKDWENSPPKIVNWIKTVYRVDVPEDVVDSLKKGNLSPLDIDTVCLSHSHFDHSGNTAPFTQSELVVGGDTPDLFIGGFWPTNSEAFFVENFLPPERTRYLRNDVDWQPIGPFPRAYDFYGDGSVYIIDAPGHLSGHVNLLARTSADGGWIYLAGDTAHSWNLITGKSAIACGHPGHLHNTAHQDQELAEAMIRRVQELMKLPRVRVLLAHDKPWYEENEGGNAFFPGTIVSLPQGQLSYSLAMSSRMLAGLAIPMLWNRINNLEHIVRVINATCPTDLLYIECERQSDDEDIEFIWSLENSLTDAVEARAKEYLAHIKNLSFPSGVSARSSTLWPLLNLVLCQTGPLLPNLVRLRFASNRSYMVSDALPYILSPSTKVLQLWFKGGISSHAAATIYNLIENKGCDLEEISFQSGMVGQEVHPAMMSLKKLKRIRTWVSFGEDDPTITISLPEFLEAFPALESLSTQMLPFRTAPSIDHVSYGRLRSLDLHTTACQFTTFFSLSDFPSLNSITLRIAKVKGVSFRRCFEEVSLRCPSLSHVTLELHHQNSRSHPFEDLVPLYSLSLEEFHLLFRGTPPSSCTFSPQDLYEIAKSWPGLRKLGINVSLKIKKNFDAFNVLSLLSMHPSLCELHMKLDFKSLLSPTEFHLLSKDLGTRNLNSPLRYVTCDAKGVQDTADMTHLARHLLWLLPNLDPRKYRNGDSGSFELSNRIYEVREGRVQDDSEDALSDVVAQGMERLSIEEDLEIADIFKDVLPGFL
ncbi:hypothetical protein NP233_g10550 [Leucocoprinus birnbaumii]|uniref:Metallo-beta-lactamase domain-containing protein n=1 Tax=Leucocoprinus birnbaumii TaxID=56174 RepID=A0AAD5VK49_9AGAR|nr:hypothetical protein NP233_g10550 [Leucocoprinus birnbaumii]